MRQFQCFIANDVEATEITALADDLNLIFLPSYRAIINDNVGLERPSTSFDHSREYQRSLLVDVSHCDTRSNAKIMKDLYKIKSFNNIIHKIVVI